MVYSASDYQCDMAVDVASESSGIETGGHGDGAICDPIRPWSGNSRPFQDPLVSKYNMTDIFATYRK